MATGQLNNCTIWEQNYDNTFLPIKTKVVNQPVKNSSISWQFSIVWIYSKFVVFDPRWRYRYAFHCIWQFTITLFKLQTALSTKIIISFGFSLSELVWVVLQCIGINLSSSSSSPDLVTSSPCKSSTPSTWNYWEIIKFSKIHIIFSTIT